MEKIALRKKFLKTRDKLLEEKRILKSIAIKEKLLSIPEYKRAKVVMFYCSIQSEVMTNEMIESALSNKNKIICVPKIFTKERKMDAVEINENTCFEKGNFDILQPFDGKVIPKKEVDLIVIPALAFDFYGNRLGYGKGYYDKFLKGIKAVKIGIAYDFQIADKLPKEEHDIKIDVLITEKRIVRFTNRK